ncbi:MAG: TSUP family transporter [Christensenellales bacterium]
MDRKKKTITFFVFAVLVGIINGLFGGGGGMLCVPIFRNLLQLEDKQSHATAVMVMSIVSIPTLIVYLFSLPFRAEVGVMITIGSLIGGIVGSIALKKIDNKLLNLLFIIVLIASGIKMFF